MEDSFEPIFTEHEESNVLKMGGINNSDAEVSENTQNNRSEKVKEKAREIGNCFTDMIKSFARLSSLIFIILSLVSLLTIGVILVVTIFFIKDDDGEIIGAFSIIGEKNEAFNHYKYSGVASRIMEQFQVKLDQTDAEIKNNLRGNVMDLYNKNAIYWLHDQNVYSTNSKTGETSLMFSDNNRKVIGICSTATEDKDGILIGIVELKDSGEFLVFDITSKTIIYTIEEAVLPKLSEFLHTSITFNTHTNSVSLLFAEKAAEDANEEEKKVHYYLEVSMTGNLLFSNKFSIERQVLALKWDNYKNNGDDSVLIAATEEVNKEEGGYSLDFFEWDFDKINNTILWSTEKISIENPTPVIQSSLDLSYFSMYFKEHNFTRDYRISSFVLEKSYKLISFKVEFPHYTVTSHSTFIESDFYALNLDPYL